MPELIGITGDARAVEAVSTYLQQADGCVVIRPDLAALETACYSIAEAFGDVACGLVLLEVHDDAAAAFVREHGGTVLHLVCCNDDERPAVTLVADWDVRITGDPDALCIAVRDYISGGKTREVCDG